jgi:hypothetical protein
MPSRLRPRPRHHPANRPARRLNACLGGSGMCNGSCANYRLDARKCRPGARHSLTCFPKRRYGSRSTRSRKSVWLTEAALIGPAKLTLKPAHRVRSEGVGGHHLDVGVRTLHALECAVFEAFGSVRDGSGDHPRPAVRTTRTKDRQKFRIGFFQGFMMATLAPTFRGCLSGLQDQIMEPAGNEDAASGGGYLLGDWAGGSTSGARGLRSGGGLASNCDLRSAAFSTSMAAKSGFAVDLANLRIVVA